VSPQDVKYQFTWQASYDLPIGKGRALDLGRAGNAVLAGWTTNGVAYVSSGVPINSPIAGASPSYFNQRTDMACDPSKGAPHTAAQWFSPTCFTAPASPFVAGTAPAYLDHVRTMGAQDIDLTLFKSFNVENKVQFGTPNVSSLNNNYQDFGLIQSDINSPRQLQFGSRFAF